jgi:predicted membrane channel-forming protein YqfA (hemolysin III family)
VNGAVSVVASVLTALVALSTGFTVVLVAGAICYSVAMAAIKD